MRRILASIAAIALSLPAAACSSDPEPPDRAEVVADFCERAARLQGLDPPMAPEDMRLLALALIDDADRFRELGERPTARRIRSYAFFLRNRAEAPDSIPARAMDPRLLTMCVSGAEPGG